MSANIIESFFVSLGFEVNTQGLEEMRKKTEEAQSMMLTFVGGAAAAAGAIGIFVGQVAEGIDELGDFAELNQMSIEALQEIGYAAQLSGSSIEAVKASVAGVNKTVGEAALGIGRGAQTFEKLGMSAKNADGSIKTFDQLMQEVADKMDGLSRQEQIALAEKLGIDRSLIPLLAKGRDELEALRAEAQAFGVTSEDDAKKAGALTDSLDRTKFMVGALGKYIAVGLMPQVTTVLDGFRDWMVSNQKVIKSGIGAALKTVTAILGTMWDWVLRLVSGLKNAYDWLTQFKTAIYAAAVAVGVFIAYQVGTFFNNLWASIKLATAALRTFVATGAAAAAPLVLIGALAAAIALLIDDYVNWKEGNDSVIGGLVEQFPALLGIIKTIEDGVGSFIDFWLQQWDSLNGPLSSLAGAIWNLVTTVVGALWPVVKMVFTGWAYILAAVIPIVATLIEWIAGFLVGAIRFVVDALTWIVQAATTVFQGVVAVVQFAIDAIVAYFTWWWQTVVQIYQFIVGIVGQVVDAVMGGVKGAVDWVMGILDSAQQKVMGFISTVTGAIGKVGELLGLTSSAKDVKVEVSKTEDATPASDPAPHGQPAQAVAQSPAAQDQPAAMLARQGQMTPIAQAVAQSPAMQNAPVDSSTPTPMAPALQQQGGVMGRASNTTTNSTTVTQTTQVTGTTIQISSPDPAKAGEAVRQELDKMNKQTTRNGQSAVTL